MEGRRQALPAYRYVSTSCLINAFSLAVTDVVELNVDPSGQSLGSKLIVDGTHQFSDLDELIVNHVQAMARKVEELMMHEKFRPAEDDLRAYSPNSSCVPRLTLSQICSSGTLWQPTLRRARMASRSIASDLGISIFVTLRTKTRQCRPGYVPRSAVLDS